MHRLDNNIKMYNKFGFSDCELDSSGACKGQAGIVDTIMVLLFPQIAEMADNFVTS
jgi:tagatose-1,6-bisphosphate aldolase non-catalytic subunit AgaZ/GatZ